MRVLLSACLLLTPGAVNAFVTPSHQPLTTATSLQAGPFGGLGDQLGKEIGSLFKSETEAPKEEDPKPALPDVVVQPEYKLGIIFLALGALLDTVPYIQLTLGPLVTALGVLFVVQTSRIRFCFDSSAFELRTGDGLEQTGENIVVGGENRWAYNSFVNYEFYPEGWIDQPQGPILVYFKETQTPSDKWNEGPGESANSEEAIAKGAVPGQVHFFPALCDCKQLQAEFERRGCAKL